MKNRHPHKRKALAWFEHEPHRSMDNTHHANTVEPGGRRVRAQMRTNHRKWPQGTQVEIFVRTEEIPGGVYIQGTISGFLKDNLSRVTLTLSEDLWNVRTAKGGDYIGRLVPFAKLHRLSNHYTVNNNHDKTDTT